MEIEDGGPAFPTEVVMTNDGIKYDGMTLRDYFAAKAMVGLISSYRGVRAINYEGLASISFEAADAMLEARKSNG